MTMTREELGILHADVCDSARQLMSRKNHDYARADDPFKNFRRYGAVGILVRLSDKLSRLDAFVENGKFMVTDETLRDTIYDIINYAVLFEGYMIGEGKIAPKANPWNGLTSPFSGMDCSVSGSTIPGGQQ